MSEVTLGAALLAGFVYFASPCVWPLYPAYLSLLAGGHAAEVRVERLLFRALAFVVGFTLVFVALGAAASGVGRLLLAYQPVLVRVAGVVIVALGLHMLGVLALPLPAGGRPFRGGAGEAGPLGAVLAGVSFGVGWTPCVGPVLASILLLASSTATVADGMRLLLAFSIGLAVPFLGLALALSRLAGRLPAAGPALARLNRLAGYGLVALGVLVYFDLLSRLGAWLFYLFS